MNDDDIVPIGKQSTALPAVREHGGVVVSRQPEGLIIRGDPMEVESYLSRIREVAGGAIRVVGIDDLAEAAKVASKLGQSGTFVQLHPDSVEAIQAGNLIPGTDGYFRMMTRGADGQFLEQLQWAPTSIDPTALLSVDMSLLAVQLALKFAIRQVEKKLQRFQEKVEALQRIFSSIRVGDVFTDNRTVSDMVVDLERHGRLPDADWNSGLGHAIDRTVEPLRIHVTSILNSFDPKAPIQKRSDTVGRAVNELGETLALLIVAEDSLYKWQRLRIARIEAAEPEHLKQAIKVARERLEHHFKEDAALYRKAKESLEEIKKTEATDGFWYQSVQSLQRDTNKLREDLDEFARARGLQESEWTEFEDRSRGGAFKAALDKATEKASRVLDATGERIVQVSSAAKPALDIATEKAGQALATTGERIAQVGNAAKPVLDIATEKAGQVLAATGEGISKAGNFFPRGQPQKEAIAKDEPVKENGQTE